jgi:TP901 family phage tail tape measure protein
MARQDLTVRFLGDSKPLRKEAAGLKKALAFGAVAAAAIVVAKALNGIYKGLKHSAKAAAQFEQEMSYVQSLMIGQSKTMKEEVNKQTREIAKEFGISIPQAAKLAGDAISNGINPEDMKDYATEVGKTAIAIGASLADTGKLFLKVKANFRDLEDSEIGNTIANAIKYGAANGGELAANLGDVLAIAKGIGVAMGDSAMAYSALVGTSGAEGAKTQLGELMAAISNDSQKFASIGITAEFIKSDGIMGVVKKLQGVINGSPIKLHKYLGTKNAKLGFQNLLSQMPLLKAGIAGIKFDKDTRDLMFGERTSTLTFQMNQLKAILNDIAIQVGSGMLTAIRDVVIEFRKLADSKEDIQAMAEAARDLAIVLGWCAKSAIKTVTALQKSKKSIWKRHGKVGAWVAEKLLADPNAGKANTDKDVRVARMGLARKNIQEIDREYWGKRIWNKAGKEEQATPKYQEYMQNRTVHMQKYIKNTDNKNDFMAKQYLEIIAKNTEKVEAR